MIKKNVLLLLLFIMPFQRSAGFFETQNLSISTFDQSTLWKVIACLGVGLFVIDKSIPYIKHYFYGSQNNESVTQQQYAQKQELEATALAFQGKINALSNALEQQQNIIKDEFNTYIEQQKSAFDQRYILQQTIDTEMIVFLKKLQTVNPEQLKTFIENIEFYKELLENYKFIKAQAKRFKKRLKALENKQMHSTEHSKDQTTLEAIKANDDYNSEEEPNDEDIRE